MDYEYIKTDYLEMVAGGDPGPVKGTGRHVQGPGC